MTPHNQSEYERHSHTHCFDQKDPPCGLGNNHKRCCLCDAKPSEAVCNHEQDFRYPVIDTYPQQFPCKKCGKLYTEPIKEEPMEDFCKKHPSNQRPPSPTSDSWEKLMDKFDDLFPKDQEAIDGIRPSKSNRSAALVLLAEFKMFLQQELDRERAKIRQNIGLLRQWLNEDRITDPHKMVKNEEINHWLELNQLKQ